MNLYPAIDLFQGEVVRLTRGDYAQKVVYSKFPGEIAAHWASQGATWIHVVDLEGAKSGTVTNHEALLKIRNAVSCRIQFGGGVRRMNDIETLLKAGVDRVVLGTKALDPVFFTEVLSRFGSQIAVSLDVREGKVQTQGWLEPGRETIDEALKRFQDFPLETIIYTDIQKDGMLQGPNFDELTRILRRTRSSVILSGGISSLADIEACVKIKQSNFEGAIIGKALYEKRVELAEAVRLVRAR